MTKAKTVAVILAAGMLVALGALSAATLPLRSFWTLPAVEPSAEAEFGFSAVRLDAVCDGPHRVYLMRSGPVPVSNYAQIAVIPNGCVTLPAR